MRRLFPALVWLAGFAAAQPASDLLQSAIYSQDTRGDLDAAIRTYRQILDAGASMKLYAPQAQYRLGTCLQRKGDTAGAAQAFEAVIRNYAGQPELVASARESLALLGGLLPAPWHDDELAEYRWTIPGVEDGWMLTRIHAVPDRTAGMFRIQTSLYTPRLYLSQVDVDQATMRPRASVFHRADQGNTRFEYPAPAKDQLYDYGEVLQLLRRMPLSPGWTTSIPTRFSGGARLTYRAVVSGRESVVVPAGTFECFKVRLSNAPTAASLAILLGPGPSHGETLWYGVDGARPLVKMDLSGDVGELVSLGTASHAGTSSYRDPKVGYSFTVPAGWVFHSRTAFNGPGDSVDLLDPDSQVWVVVSAKPQKTASADIERALRTGAEERFANSRRGLSGYTIRVGAERLWRLGGHQALTWIADYTEGGERMTEYITWVQSESVRASFVARLQTSDFEPFRERFDAILNSFRIP